jgi:hypothetical protein
VRNLLNFEYTHVLLLIHQHKKNCLKPDSFLKIILLFFSVIAGMPLLNAQNRGTSLDEYRYFSKGYAYQRDMGLDAQKEGYEIATIYRSPNGVDVRGLIEKSSGLTKALLYEIPLEEKGKIKYFCMPHPDSPEEVKSLFQEDRRLLQGKSRLKFEEAAQGIIFAHLKGNASSELMPKEISEEEARLPSAYENPKQKNRIRRGIDSSGYEVPAITPKGTRVETRVEGPLQNRLIIEKPQLKNQSRAGGIVVIKVCVNGAGDVVSARFSQKGSTTIAPELTSAAERTAFRYRFSLKDQKEECGTITFDFK